VQQNGWSFEQFGVLLGGLAAGAMMANSGCFACLRYIASAFASGDWKIGISFFSSLDTCICCAQQQEQHLLCSNPDKLSRPRTRKSRLGRWRKFLLFNACPVFFLFFTFSFLSVNSSSCVCVSRLHIPSSSNLCNLILPFVRFELQ
jgi:hypothetical protein